MSGMVKGRSWYAKRSRAIRQNWTWFWASPARTVRRRRSLLLGLAAR